MKRLLSITAAVILSGYIGLSAQTRFSDKVEMEETIYDFGDIYMSDGAVSHTFKLKNISSAGLSILSVISSCGCTDVTWTRNTLKPGESGEISATYSNDEGPYPFDKTLTVFVSELSKPIILHLRGTTIQKAVPLAEAYPIHFGSLGFKETEIRAGNMSQGEQRNGQIKLANIGKSPISISFADVSENLELKVSPNPIPAKGTATLTYNITADRKNWGKCWYYATPMVNGKIQTAQGKSVPQETAAGGEAIISEPNPELGAGHSKIGFWAFTKENFGNMSKDERKNAAMPSFKSTTNSYGRVSAGKKVTAEFEITNTGKEALVIYKADSDTHRAKAVLPGKISPGAKGKLTVEFDTTGLGKGEAMVIINLTTNSPVRPLVALCLTGTIN